MNYYKVLVWRNKINFLPKQLPLLTELHARLTRMTGFLKPAYTSALFKPEDTETREEDEEEDEEGGKHAFSL